MTKKILFSLSMGVGLLMAVPALAAAVAPTTAVGAANNQAQILQLNGQTPQSITSSAYRMPCPVIMNQGMGAGNMMYQNYPCNQNGYGTRPVMAYYGSHDIMAWYGLASVITLALVWAVLLLLICVLWKILQKHKRG